MAISRNNTTQVHRATEERRETEEQHETPRTRRHSLISPNYTEPNYPTIRRINDIENGVLEGVVGGVTLGGLTATLAPVIAIVTDIMEQNQHLETESYAHKASTLAGSTVKALAVTTPKVALSGCAVAVLSLIHI